MDPREATFVLIHSPLVGSLTWQYVGAELQRRGMRTFIPEVKDAPGSSAPFWMQHADSVSNQLELLEQDPRLILVAHSGAGPLLPAISQRTSKEVTGCIFVDASIPRANATRLELMKSEEPEWAEALEDELRHGVRFPTWDEADLKGIVPDDEMRRKLVQVLRPRSLSFFLESIPVPASWPDVPGGYLRFSAPYHEPATRAAELGWTVYALEAGHFHMLVNPRVVADILLELASEL